MNNKQFEEKFSTELNDMIPDNKDIIKRRLGILEKERKPHHSFAKPLLAFAMVLLLAFGLTTIFF